MTAIVTVDQIVPALTADLSSSTEAEKEALRTALGASAGGGGGGTSSGGTFLYETTAKQMISPSWAGTSSNPIDTPISWNSQVSTASFGTFDGKKFTFTQDTRALVSFGVAGALLFASGTGTVTNHSFRFQLNCTTNGTTFGYYGAQNLEPQGGFTIAGAGNSIVRQFKAGDSVFVAATIWTEGVTISGDSFYGYTGGNLPNFRSYFSVAAV